MAKRKPLVRFYVRHSGFNAELFGVRETGSGDLIVKLKPIFYEQSFLSPTQHQVIEEKYTVHLSAQTDGHTLTHTCVYAERPDERMVSFVKCAEKPLLAVLFSTRHTSLIEPLFRMRVSDKDKRVKVAEFDITKNTLIDHVVVATKGAFDAESLGLPWHITTHSFREFDIHLVHCFLHWPAEETGDTLRTPSIRERKLGAFVSEMTKHPLPTLTPDSLKSKIDEIHSALQRRGMPRSMLPIINRMTPLGASTPDIERELNKLWFANYTIHRDAAE